MENSCSTFVLMCLFFFCFIYQLAQGSGSHPSFAVAEYETADQTELVQRSANGMLIGGSHVHISFCAPGPAGRCTLAALIAAQRLVSKIFNPLFRMFKL